MTRDVIISIGFGIYNLHDLTTYDRTEKQGK